VTVPSGMAHLGDGLLQGLGSMPTSTLGNQLESWGGSLSEPQPTRSGGLPSANRPPLVDVPSEGESLVNYSSVARDAKMPSPSPEGSHQRLRGLSGSTNQGISDMVTMEPLARVRLPEIGPKSSWVPARESLASDEIQRRRRFRAERLASMRQRRASNKELASSGSARAAVSARLQGPLDPLRLDVVRSTMRRFRRSNRENQAVWDDQSACPRGERLRSAVPSLALLRDVECAMHAVEHTRAEGVMRERVQHQVFDRVRKLCEYERQKHRKGPAAAAAENEEVEDPAREQPPPAVTASSVELVPLEKLAPSIFVPIQSQASVPQQLALAALTEKTETTAHWRGSLRRDVRRAVAHMAPDVGGAPPHADPIHQPLHELRRALSSARRAFARRTDARLRRASERAQGKPPTGPSEASITADVELVKAIDATKHLMEVSKAPSGKSRRERGALGGNDMFGMLVTSDSLLDLVRDNVAERIERRTGRRSQPRASVPQSDGVLIVEVKEDDLVQSDVLSLPPEEVVATQLGEYPSVSLSTTSRIR
jgi:hypothetical protein